MWSSMTSCICGVEKQSNCQMRTESWALIVKLKFPISEWWIVIIESRGKLKMDTRTVVESYTLWWW